ERGHKKFFFGGLVKKKFGMGGFLGAAHGWPRGGPGAAHGWPGASRGGGRGANNLQNNELTTYPVENLGWLAGANNLQNNGLAVGRPWAGRMGDRGGCRGGCQGPTIYRIMGRLELTTYPVGAARGRPRGGRGGGQGGSWVGR